MDGYRALSFRPYFFVLELSGRAYGEDSDPPLQILADISPRPTSILKGWISTKVAKLLQASLEDPTVSWFLERKKANWKISMEIFKNFFWFENTKDGIALIRVWWCQKRSRSFGSSVSVWNLVIKGFSGTVGWLSWFHCARFHPSFCKLLFLNFRRKFRTQGNRLLGSLYSRKIENGVIQPILIRMGITWIIQHRQGLNPCSL